MRRGPWRRPTPRRGRRRCELADPTDGRGGLCSACPVGKHVSRQIGKILLLREVQRKNLHKALESNASAVHQSLASRRRVAARPIAAAPATATAQHLRAIYATETASLVGGRWLHFAALSRARRARGPPAHIDMQSTLPKSVGHEFALLTLPLLHPRVQKQATNDVQASR